MGPCYEPGQFSGTPVSYILSRQKHCRLFHEQTDEFLNDGQRGQSW